MQTRLPEYKLPDKKKHEFLLIIAQALANLRNEMADQRSLDEIVHGNKKLQRSHTKLNTKPEELTKDLVIEPLLKFLGYEKLGKSSSSLGDIDRREADYTLMVNGEPILVEAEPLNKWLHNDRKGGIEQLKSNLDKRSFRGAELGIATNGFDWVLLKYDTKTNKCTQIEEAATDLRSFFNTELKGEGSLLDKDSILQNFYWYFALASIISSSAKFTRMLEAKKENITSKFYHDYILYVFGYDTKKESYEKSLLSTLKAPQGTPEQSKRLFVMTLMSRLIFLKFLEDKKLVKPRFLSTLFESYKKSTALSSFYRAYLHPLFYDVLNTPVVKRNRNILRVPEFETIPYLNGGLFRDVVDDEFQYNVDDEILGAVIELLQSYHFTLQENPDALNPDVLGLVFERTINYLTGEGDTDRRRNLGAYYTPDDVTTYISKETIRNRIFDIVREYLQTIGWRASDIDDYKSLEDFLDNPPKHKKTLNSIYEKISEITILDPACGSGHFLTSVLKEIFHIRTRLINQLDGNMNSYDIKRDIISRNLFGVDIESSAVEIAQLRLWLSLIEDLDTHNHHGEIDTLPNIEYNIEKGNSLLGYTSAPEARQSGIDIGDNISIKKIFEEIDELKRMFRLTSDPTRAEELKKTIEKWISLYNSKLNEALVSNLVDHKISSSFDEISEMNPFHWRLKFSDVFARKDGFDIIVGNPPYVEKNKLNYPTAMFVSKAGGSTYAYFLEMSLKILCKGGYLGFIVPLATICSKRMIPLHQIFLRDCSLIRVSNFDNRPGKIFFQGLEDCRSSIIISKKKEKANDKTSIYSTKYNRWYANERNRLFTNLEFVECSTAITPGVIPKVGKELELDILLKLNSQSSTLSKYLGNNGKMAVWYSRPVRYWIKAADFIPAFKSGGRKMSSNLHKLKVDDHVIQNQLIAILNSSLFYWFFIVTSYCRDLNINDIKNFHIDFDSMAPEDSKLLGEYCIKLMEDLQEHSKTKKANYKSGGVELQEFNVKYSKPIIDKIDQVLAKHYGLTDDEKDFIIHFDERFRLKDLSQNSRLL